VRWPRRYRGLPPAPDVEVYLGEAKQAVSDALDDLAETRDRGAKVRKTAATLRKIRHENDFARTIRNALKP
jgi:hypothetical protein